MKQNETMKNWPKEINDLSDIPEFFKTRSLEFVNFFKEKNPIIVHLPYDKQKNRLESLLICFTKAIILLLKENDKIAKKEISFNSINYAELKIILLNSSLSLYSSTDSLKVPFNTASEKIFHKILERIRKYNNTEKNTEKSHNKLDYLKDLNLKLYNYSKYALNKSNKIFDTVYQEGKPKINIKSSVTILTTDELIFIEEADENEKPEKSLYGGKWVYIPINKINTVNISNTKNKKTFNLNTIFTDESKNSIEYYYETKSSFKTFDEKVRSLL